MVLEDSQVRVILLDIEGTVCPISFVKDVLFPYSLQVLPSILSTEWDTRQFRPFRDAFPPEHRTNPSAFTSHVHDLTARDIKAPYLKSLQGHLWTQGYISGALTCPLFPDVSPAFLSWTQAIPPVTLIIYSSGSIAAQKLLFQHTNAGDLRPLLTDYFDTTTAGPKTERASYDRIWEAHASRGERGTWLFLTDNVWEVRAAREAGMPARLVVREGNVPVGEEERRELGAVEDFGEVRIRGVGGGGSATETGNGTTKGSGEDSDR